MSYINVAQLKSYLGISVDLEGDDALLQTFVNAAVATVENIAGFSFAVANTSTRYFDPPLSGSWSKRRDLVFDTWLAATPTSVTNGDATSVASSSYVTVPVNYLPIHTLRLKSNADVYWTYDESPENAIAVTGYWGWSRTPPEDILRATTRIAAFFYRQKDSQIFDHTAFTELGPIRMKSELPEDAVRALDRYIWRTE